MTDLFTTMSDTTKQIAEMNSGSYAFEPFSNLSEEEKHLKQFDQLPSLEEQSKSSLYKLLDHPWENLHLLGLAVLNYKLYLMNVKDKNPAMWEKICAWETLINSAIKQRSERDSEAWAEQTAKEIKEAVK